MRSFPARFAARAYAVAAVTALVAVSASVLAAQAPAPTPTGASTFDSTRFGGLHWRSIGPYRGGRVTTVAGVTQDPRTFYMGATGGGIWKTTDAGANWRNVSDGQIRMGSIGALGVAPGDPNVVYAGMGESEPRGQSSSWGDGMYRSTDAGKTWTHIGLDASIAIAKVRVDPRDPDVVYVAAQGSKWAPGPHRGIYKSTDGGAHWSLVLHPSDSASAIDLSMDPSNPRILYAAMWDFQRTPWQIRSGGPWSGIWKTTDAGATWTRLTGHGLPTGLVGRIGVSVSPANPNRIFALIEARGDTGGLYRSDDGGSSWHHFSAQREIRDRAWYYTSVIADPQDENLVYVMNAPIMKSIDGGKTFQVLPALHGDNHDLWINPQHHDDMVNGNDGGASVTLDGGRSWSTQDNQPTAQIYRVNTDAQYPYWVYGAQQDNTSIATPSAAPGGITAADWYPVAGCESSHLVFDPNDPRYIYGDCYQGIIEEFDRTTRRSRSISPYPSMNLTERTDSTRYRFNWSSPLAASPQNPRVMYWGGNVLFRTSDRGQHWQVISPDLTRNEKAHQGWGGAPITNEGAGGETYNTIYYIAPSPHDSGTIWVGTDDGLVQLTRDGGQTWSNVTPKGVGPGFVNAIEVSPWEAGTAYITYDGYKWNDRAPHIFKTTDYGRSWTELVHGIRAEDQVRVVRADRVRRGLLYAGTETGAYVSFDDGRDWQSLQANLPSVPVTDLQIRNGDLVASTEGRAFWILDDLSPLEQNAEAVSASDTKLFTPRDAFLTEWGGGFGGGGTGANPPSGAVLYYHIAAGTDSTGVTLEILGANGALVRRYAAKPAPGEGAIAGSPGMHRAVWDLRTTGLDAPHGVNFFGSTAGHLVAPGTYTVRLSAGGKTVTAPLTVRQDPRDHLTADEIAEQQRVLTVIDGRITAIFHDAKRLNDVRDQVKAITGHAKDLPNSDQVSTTGAQLAGRLDSLSVRLVQPQHTTGQDIINFPNGVVDQWVYLAGQVDGSYMPVTGGVTQRLADLQAQWPSIQARIDDLLGAQVNAFNALLQGKAAVIVPPAADKPIP
ncbi:MAG TPA: glycosyl hydrolase [Gemmatimonadaceae bacterium]|nr:glycosyl hydrolase [Gemmatimonadaceae bacterium]